MKNTHKKHMIRKSGMAYSGKYLCITAVDPTPEKSVHTWDKVTCKNCLARMPQEAKRRMQRKVKKDILKEKQQKANAQSIQEKTADVQRMTGRQPSPGVQFGYLRAVPKTPVKLSLVEEDEVKLFHRLAYSAGYAKGMRDGIIGNYIIVAAAIVLAIVLVIVL